ncbi:glycosyltransferase [Micromonospora sp. NPDC051006]|uniref:glycosyltransferase n=1 Tax=Micromonospora sp. NPDC051006 TaxID=3364283 RepID=UPI0037A283C3
MRLRVDATPIRPGHSAGVATFTTGLLNGLAEGTGHELAVTALKGTVDSWRQLVPDTRLDWSEAALALRTDNPVGDLLRRCTPRRVHSSLAMRRVINMIRQRARASAPDDADVTLHPFHCVPIGRGRNVVVVHDLRHLHPDFGSAGYAAVIGDNVARADAVVVSWPHPYRQVCNAFPGARDKTVLIPPPTFQAAPDRSLAAPEPDLLVYPSSTGPHKNHRTLLEAMALLPEFRLVCPGPLLQPEAQRLLARAAEPELRGRVSFPGYVSTTQLHTLYARAAAMVMPSLWEAASGPAFEAFSWGLPLICADVEPLRAQLEFVDGEAGMFSPTDPVSLANAVRRVLADREHYAAASVRAGHRLAGRTWVDTARDYDAVLEWVAADTPGPVPRSTFISDPVGSGEPE